MPNPQRGEVAAILDGQSRTLCLTLGALAELETTLHAPDLVTLAERFEAGHLSARDAIAVIGAGLRGAGGSETDADVAALRLEGPATEAMRLTAALLTAAFSPSPDIRA